MLGTALSCVRVGVGRMGPIVRLRDGVSVGVGGEGGVDCDGVLVVERGEIVALGLVRPVLAGGHELAGELARDASVARVPFEALRNGVSE
jgi:hypothetical protein